MTKKSGEADKNCLRCGGKGRAYTYSKTLDCPCVSRTTALPPRVKCPLCGSSSTRRTDGGKPGELSRHGSLGWSCNGVVLDRR